MFFSRSLSLHKESSRLHFDFSRDSFPLDSLFGLIGDLFFLFEKECALLIPSQPVLPVVRFSTRCFRSPEVPLILSPAARLFCFETRFPGEWSVLRDSAFSLVGLCRFDVDFSCPSLLSASRRRGRIWSPQQFRATGAFPSYLSPTFHPLKIFLGHPVHRAFPRPELPYVGSNSVSR